MFGRRRQVPPEAAPLLGPEERVLAWARAGPDEAVVATNLGLFLPGHGRRLGWHEIHRASWSGRDLVVTPAVLVEEHPGYAVMADAPPVMVTLPDPGDVPQVVRARVTHSVSFSSHQPVPGGAVRVVARRVPGVDGLAWTVRYDEGTDSGAAGVRDATSQLVVSLASSATNEPS